MERAYVEELHIESYGCIRDATFRLTPLHALIGPNDSGKSTVLRALMTLAPLIIAERTVDLPRLLQRALNPNGSLFRIGSRNEKWSIRSSPAATTVSGPFIDGPRTGASARIQSALAGAQLLRLDPDALRTPRPLIPDGQPLRFEDDRGSGLPAIYDAIVTRDIQAFLALNAEFTRLFPDVKSISLTNPSAGAKAMGIKLNDGTFVPAELMSEGMLYYLAFAALRHMDPTALLLIEEPENGLHPARIAEVMRILREISRTTQVIIATHSPLVVNELRPDEVTVVTRTREHGTKATLMKDTADFDERFKVYALGELWLSYANGEDERPLLEGGPRP